MAIPGVTQSPVRAAERCRWSPVNDRSHLEAALAVWSYAEESARYVFGDAMGDPVADELRGALRQFPQGLTRTEIYHLFKGNRSKSVVTAALSSLKTSGLAHMSLERTEGRPIERWFHGPGEPAQQ